MQSAMSEARSSQMLEVQSYTKEGAPILAWVATPFHFDFKRNKIMLLEALSDKWLPDFPLDTDVKTLWKYFADTGIQYIIWQSSGHGVKNNSWYQNNKGPSTTRKLFFIKSMQTLATTQN